MSDDPRITELQAEGYTVLRTSSYKRAQERHRIAEVRMLDAFDERDANRAWALDCLKEERRLRDRCTFLYGVARAHGATVDELAGSAQ